MRFQEVNLNAYIRPIYASTDFRASVYQRNLNGTYALPKVKTFTAYDEALNWIKTIDQNLTLDLASIKRK